MERKTIGVELIVTQTGDIVGIHIWEDPDCPIELTPAQIMLLNFFLKDPECPTQT